MLVVAVSVGATLIRIEDSVVVPLDVLEACIELVHWGRSSCSAGTSGDFAKGWCTTDVVNVVGAKP